METVQSIQDYLERFAPSRLAEEWDNVGLLVGDGGRSVERLMTCLTITPETVDEATSQRADLIVAHHPLPFRPLKRLTSETTAGRLLLAVIRADIAVYSPHTAFDSAASGINQRLAEGICLAGIEPLMVREGDPQGLGAGRWGRLATRESLSDVAGRLKQFLGVSGVRAVGRPERLVQTVAVGCGSAGQFLERAQRLGCDLLVTGETSFHTCLEAQASGIALLLPGHFASERFAVEQLAGVLAEAFPSLSVWASRCESDPLAWL